MSRSILVGPVVLACLVVACGGGGQKGSGGASPSGAGSGGNTAISSGGAPGTDGPPGTGGFVGTGGLGTGGSASGTGGVATGGTSASGGASSTGGVSGSGGRSASGGTTGAAGMGARGGSASGGTASQGGASGSGGRSSGGGAAGTQGVVDGGVSDGGADAPSFPGNNNPVLAGLNADPQVALFDGVFYVYPTTDGFANWEATSFSVWSSTNLVQWTSRGVVLDLPKDLKWATGHAWAPGIARRGSTYYFYFCADSQIGVATGSSPLGPFKDALGHALITTRQYGPQSIDPYLFTDDDGTPYLYFGSGTGGLRVVKMNSDMISFSGTPTNISPSGATAVLEGSVMFKRNGTYYLQWSEGDTRTATYQVAYAKAASPLGPFTRLAVILKQDTNLGILGPGGHTVLAIPERDEYYAVYHRFKVPGGDGTHREVCIDRMSFNGDGTIVPVKPTLQGLQTAVAPP